MPVCSVLYIHPKTTSTSKCQQLLIYCDIFSWTIALFAVVDKNFPNLADRSEWFLFLPFVSGCTIIETNTAQKKTKASLAEPWSIRRDSHPIWTFLLWLHDCPYWHLRTAKPQLELKSLLRTCLWKLLWHAVSHDRGNSYTGICFFNNFLCHAVVKQKHEYLQKKNWGESARAYTMSWCCGLEVFQQWSSRLGRPPITISASETFSTETQNRRQIPLSGRISWCILGCSTWWQRGGRFIWNIKNVGWCRIWS